MLLPLLILYQLELEKDKFYRYKPYCYTITYTILLDMFFQTFLKKWLEACFPNCSKVSSVVPVFKNVGESSTAKNHGPVRLLSVVSKVFEQLLNNRYVNHIEKSGLLSDFQYDFTSFQL